MDVPTMQTWIRRGVGTGVASYQYALLVVFIGAIITVATGDTTPATVEGPLLIRFVDVPFISRALAAELGGYGLFARMVVSVLTFLTYTGLVLPILHGAQLPVTAPGTGYVVTLPDVTMFGMGIDPVLTAVPAVVIVASAALPALDREAALEPMTILQIGGVTGVTYAASILVIAGLAREILFAVLTAIGGADATTGVTVHLLTPGTGAIVAGYAVVLAIIGTGIGYLVQDVDRSR